MQKRLFLFVVLVSLLFIVGGCINQGNVSKRDDCVKTGGIPNTEFNTGCADLCVFVMEDYPDCDMQITYSCDCGLNKCWNGTACILNERYCVNLNERKCSGSKYCEPIYVICDQGPTCLIDTNNASNSYCYNESCTKGTFHRCIEGGFKEQLEEELIPALKPEDKISPKTLIGNYSLWILSHDGKLYLMVGFYENISSSKEAADILKKYGELIKYGQVIQNKLDHNHMDVKIDKGKVLDLAKESSVKWIKEAQEVYRFNISEDLVEMWRGDKKRKMDGCIGLYTELERRRMIRAGVVPEGGLGFGAEGFCNEYYRMGEIEYITKKFKNDLNKI